MAMKLGEQANLVIKSDYGYGEIGSPPKIPGGATLVFTIDLIQIGNRKPDSFYKDMMATALKLKEEGNQKFKAKKFALAINLYREAMENLDECVGKF